MKALISVWDKRGIIEFAHNLVVQEVDIISTGGTAKTLTDAGVPLTEISDYTGFPEIMDGRLKTLHPKIHGGILGRRGVDNDTMALLSIDFIDLVVVNFYPFEKAIEDPKCDLATALKNVDIGGPTMVRAAAKNWDRVAVVVDPADYDDVIVHLHQSGGFSDGFRLDLMIKAFNYTSRYEVAINNYLALFGSYVAIGTP